MAAQVALLEPVEKTEERKNEYGFPKPQITESGSSGPIGLKDLFGLPAFCARIRTSRPEWGISSLISFISPGNDDLGSSYHILRLRRF
jgi:hypothetical protein